MGQHNRLRPPRAALFAAAASFAFAPGAFAGNADYCVTCKNPDEVYRCRVTGVKASDALKLYCVIRTAKEGKHTSCSAAAATNDCVGLVKVYDYDGPPLPDGLTSDPRVKELKQRMEQEQRAFKEPKGEAPKSLFELGGRAMSASRKGLRNAGEAVGFTSETEAPPAVAPAPVPSSAPPPQQVEPAPAEPLPAHAPAAASVVPTPSEGVSASQRMKQAAQGASSAVGGFARKSYRCVRSFFRECREESGALE